MYSFEKHIKTAELPQILQMLSNSCRLKTAKEYAIKIKPSFNTDEISAMLSETQAAFDLSLKFSAPPISAIDDVTSILDHSKIGSCLSIPEIIKIGEVLRIIHNVKLWKDDPEQKEKTVIDKYFAALTPNSYLENKIRKIIKNEEELYDNASAALFDIRRKISSKTEKIRDILNKTVKNQSKYLQDSVITQRDGRFVVPVKSEYKAEIKGIVHDTSGTGQTLFVEPMSVVEANNDIRVLQTKEREEIIKILTELSAEISDFADGIRRSFDALVKIDLLFAKADLAFKMKANVPKLNKNSVINLISAKHPLIDKSKVVAIDISLGIDYSSLIITGPNTGGKTVALKTVGLLSFMTYCGLMIPASEKSEIAVFNKIFTDIGDEQSIEQSLSTFSSHMVNIISILKDCDNNSLILLDELCAGTDPIEGAALAKAILINLNKIGCKTITTTHYPELKTYALDTDDVQNASCEFDIKTLKPTYKIIIGTPGRSNAFAISKRLGLTQDIIDLASENVNEDDVRFERVVASLESARQSAAREQNRASMLRIELQKSKASADEIREKALIESEKIIENAQKKAQDILENTRYKSDELLNSLEDMKKKLKKANSADVLSRAKQTYNKSLNELEDTANPIVNAVDNEMTLTETPAQNDIVLIKSFGTEATVITVNEKDKKAQVMSGNMKMWVSFDDLATLKKKKKKEVPKFRNTKSVKSNAQRVVTGEIDIRGMASDEGVMELDKYLDDAILAGINKITVIHGKGTGVLRKAVQTYLKKHPSVLSQRPGLFGEGEMGVTIVELKP